ncbi:MAG TPA: PsiF family protein [Burkholderiales bacterium]|nr:PsiF family protein [Burkholderiales bacterium]
MIRLLVSLAFGISLATTAVAQDKPTAQQERMKSCNAQASKKALEGDERQAFMSKCLSA